MKCTICKVGATQPGTATIALERGDTTVLIKDTPAEVCENCGEYYLSEKVTAQVEELAEGAARRGAEIEVLRYGAVTV